MKKRIQSYMAYMDQQLEHNDSGLSYEELCIEHEKQLAYFMHETGYLNLCHSRFCYLFYGSYEFFHGNDCFIFCIPDFTYSLYYALLSSGKFRPVYVSAI